MTKGKSIFNFFMLVGLIGGATWLGCNKDEEGNNPTTPTISAPTSPRAYSASASSVGLAWTLSSSESDASFSGYVIRAKNPSGAVAATANAAKGISSTEVNGLADGVIYTFVIRSTATGGVESSDSASVKWSPARRYENESGFPPPIKVYETSSSSNFSSGLIFFATAGPKTVSLLDPVDSSRIDVYVKTEANNAVSLNSSHVYRGNRRITRFHVLVRDDSTLNNPQTAPPDTTSYTNSSVFFDSVQVSTGKVVYFKGNDGNYGRILVERNATTGRIIWGTSPEQYLSLRISYQSVAFNPYAKPIKVGVNSGKVQQ